jgi:hypothetical protein
MAQSTLTRLPLRYRRAEVSAIFRYILAGDSCSVVGASGVAKSNLYRFLREDEVRRHYFGNRHQEFLLVAIDGNEITQCTEEAVTNLLVKRLLTQVQEIVVGDNNLEGAVNAILEQPGRAIVFLFDQFDALYEKLSGRFFTNLRALRDEHKYRISYVLLSRKQLSAIARSSEHEEFEELFSANTIGLGPYDDGDSLLLLQRIGSRYGRQLDLSTSVRLVELTGGHPGSLKAAGLAILNERLELPDTGSRSSEALLRVADVRSECEKLWTSISNSEQYYLRRLTAALPPPRDAQTRAVLELKGLIIKTESGFTTLSPVFSEYVSRYHAVEEAAIKLTAGAISVDTAGEVWIDGAQVAPPLTKKELSLLEYLCLAPGRLRTKDEIIAVVYPDEYRTGGSISDDALSSLVKRLRDRLETHSGFSHKIVAVRGKGYRLDSY